MAESSSPGVPALDGLAIETVEWLPSGAESGLVRVRGLWIDAAARQTGLPVLALRAAGAEHRFDSLPDARFSRDPASWRGTYLVPAELVAADPEALWLEWSSDARAGLPTLSRGVEPPRVPGAAPAPEEPGGEVIDRAVLAERRARRAEAAEQQQGRVAAEAVKAVEVLELRSAELERRLEEAIAERDALAGRDEDADSRREALAAALASAAALRSRAREWQLHLRTSEVARAGDAVRLAVLESDRATTVPSLRAALLARTHELATARTEAAARAGELSAATADLEATRADLAAANEAAAAARAALGEAEQQLADGRTAWERRRQELEAELTEVRADLTRAREEAAAGATALERALATAEARAETAEARLRVETVARTTLEDELDRERAERAATSQLRAEVASLHAETAAGRAALEDLSTELDAERAARRAADQALREANRAGASLQDQIAELQRRATSSREELERLAREQAAAVVAQEPTADATRLVADLDAAEQSLRRRTPTEPLAPDPEPATTDEPEPDDPATMPQASEPAPPPDDSEPAAPDAEPASDFRYGDEWPLRGEPVKSAAQPVPPRAQPARSHEAVMAPTAVDAPAPDAEPAIEWAVPPTEPAAPDCEPAVEWSDAVDSPESRAAVLPGVAPVRAATESREIEWAPSGFTHDEEAMEPPAPDAEPFAESAPPDPPPTVDRAVSPAAPETTGPADAAVELAPPEPPASDQAVIPAPPPAAAGPRIVPASGPPPRALMIGTERREYPLLRGAVVKLAHDDPATAGRVLAALLPAQGALVQGPLTYDLTIAGSGTFGITIAAGRATVERLTRPRPRREAEFHMRADPLPLAELLAGVDHRIGRFFGPVRVRGRKSRVKALHTLRTATASLRHAARAGTTLDPELVYRTLAYAVHPSWTRGHSFTIAQAIVDHDPPETWYLTARDGAGLTVSKTPPPAPPQATVEMTRAVFDHLLRGDGVPKGQRPYVRGDRHAVALMHSWTERAT